ncbi:TNF receptor-associated factor homolog 1b isoform X2 [Brachypodium distachyon]|uniref:MATH domain-containing protein n=1 Tax=Brachypodium distachyon TaxID=15368 RepID=A0A0Q3KG43_BRADI|nr:TNF receptor-associated factor homolog 1b isoform X2 [Brachypodium distachyon]KQK10017.1 hypothetical protein BRADI_2g51517v3 [Brachypodium distachyon]PNT72960.1 hypothetical protein BRADI_2g51517v3 [Brachypodium distachyon]|eukprot:XP_010232417.1 TNF receptor-associated factor homolog 1b isoform X2 [Brachypodium distachyon]
MLTDDSAGSTTELGDEDHSVSGDSLSEWRACDQVDNDSPSTSPPFWDTDGEDDDPGPGPSNLFGGHTWKIKNFSKEKKREMKSEPFEAGGFKWYILVYPQGCDVSNHLSLFLCVADHDKHLPGWSQFAQFTIAVGNLDPKKVKYSDTLHKFWKKEHDWGWKKFMELSKIQDGFLVDDVLEIIAQVQVIREKVDRPFRCLNRPYRRELLRVYMTNIEQIYRRFVEERRNKLTKLIEDKMGWSSFRAFWLAIDPSTRRRMSREKSDIVLKIIVKHFFVEKEVTSTLVMDSLHTGLKALEHQSKGMNGRGRLMDSEELSTSMIHVDMDMFVLSGDVLALLERAALEPLPCQPLSPKDDKCSQSRTKDGSSGEVKVSIEHEEKRLTEFSQKILETFVLSHIFSGIEVAYQEAVALKRQEELIREEEEAGLLENEMKGRRSSTTDKEKRAKKKQAKQKKNNRKVKDKDRGEKSDSNFPEKDEDECTIQDMDDSKQAGQVAMKVDTSEEGASDVSDNLDGIVEVCQTNVGDKISQPVNAMNDVGIETENVHTLKNSVTENNSLSCSSESGTMNIIKGKRTTLVSPNRGRTQRSRATSSMNNAEDEDDLPSSTASSDRNASDCGPAPKLDQETVILTLKDRLEKLGQRLHEKEVEGRKLLKAHLEKKAAADAASSSSSLEKIHNVVKSPVRPPVTSSDASMCARPPKSLPVDTNGANGVTPAAPNTTRSTESGPIVAPTPSKAEPVLSKEHVSSSNLKVDGATPVTSRLLPVDKAATLPSSLLLVNKATQAPPESPAPRVAKATNAIPAPPKSSKCQADKATKAITAPPRSPAPQVERVAKAIPALPKSPAPQVDKVVPVNAVSQSNSEARKSIVSKRTAVSSVPQTPTSASRPSSAPLFQAPRATLTPTSAVQVPPLLSRSLSVSRQSRIEPSSPVPSYVPQTYRNAMIGKGNLDTTLSSVDNSSSLGQSNALSQPLSTYPSATSVMVPPLGRNVQLPGNQGFMSGLGKLEVLDNWHPWKGGGDASKHMWRDGASTPYQQIINADARIHPWNDNSYHPTSNSKTEEGRFGGIPHRRFQRDIPTNLVSHHQLQGSVGEEFPHLDIINDLLEEEQSNVSMAQSPLQEYRTFGLPFSPRGNLAEADMASLSSSGRLNLTDHYYDEGYLGAYDRMNALHRLREGHFSTSDAYSNGRVDSVSSKPWLYSYPNPMVHPGVNPNAFPQQVGDYTNHASGRVNEEYLYRRANGQW